MIEVWRAVPGHEGRYEVSDQGRVRSLRFRNNQADFVRPEPLILRECPSRAGYPRVAIAGRMRMVHLLVLEAFVGPCPPGLEGAHLNGRPADCRLSNLRWVTHLENQSHQLIHGTRARGETHGWHLHPEAVLRGEAHWNARLTEADVRAVRAGARRGERGVDLAERFDVTRSTICHIVARRLWKHLPDEVAG